MKNCLTLAFERAVVVRSLRVSLIVGTVLAAINQGDRLLAGEVSQEVVLKIALTYLVPYCVSTYASVAARRSDASG